MALGHHRHVAHRQLQRAAALLPGDEAGHRPVNLVGEKAFRTHRDQPQHVVESRGDGQTCRQGKRFGGKGHAPVGKGFLRDIAQEYRQIDIDRGGIVAGIVQNKPQIAGNLAQHLAVHLLPGADRLEFFDIFRADQKAVALLVFGHINFQDRHGRIAHPDIADLDAAAGFFHQLLEHIGRPSRPLIVDHIDQGPVAHFIAGPDDAVHFLLHFRIAALHRVEVEARFVLALQHAGGGAAAEADAVGRAAHLNDEHALFGNLFLGQPGIDLADTAGEHDRLQETPALAAGKSHVEGAGKALNERLAEFIAVIGGPVARLDLDRQRIGQIVGAGETVFPGQFIARDIQVADAVTGGAGDDEAAPAGPLHVADAAAG
ncbi:MAG: hypothetical protein ACD_75C00215G0001, partial [uncultured bacterium]